jgi:hypothetical protein
MLGQYFYKVFYYQAISFYPDILKGGLNYFKNGMNGT